MEFSQDNLYHRVKCEVTREPYPVGHWQTGVLIVRIFENGSFNVPPGLCYFGFQLVDLSKTSPEHFPYYFKPFLVSHATKMLTNKVTEYSQEELMAWFIDEIRIRRVFAHSVSRGSLAPGPSLSTLKSSLKQDRWEAKNCMGNTVKTTDLLSINQLPAKHQSTFHTSIYLTIARAQKQTRKVL